jgi:AcrR family transcriptional regulator
MTVTARTTKPRKAPRQLRSQETRARILEAAARVFAERGYAGGTTNHIAADAGISIGSLYQYFPNKDSILVELMRDHIRDGSLAVAHRLRDVGGLPSSLEAKLRLFIDALIEVHLVDHRLHRVLFEEAPRPPDIVETLRATDTWAIEAAERLLASDPDVRVADVELAARLVVTTIESLVHRFVAREGETLDPDRFATELVRMLVGYLTSQRFPTAR